MDRIGGIVEQGIRLTKEINRMKQKLSSVLQLPSSLRPQMFGDVTTKCSTSQMPSNADSIALTFEDIRARFSAVKSDTKRTMNSMTRPRQTMVLGDVKRDDDVRSDVIAQPRTTRAPSVGKYSEQLANVRFSRKCEDKENFFYRLQKSDRIPVGSDAVREQGSSLLPFSGRKTVGSEIADNRSLSEEHPNCVSNQPVKSAIPERSVSTTQNETSLWSVSPLSHDVIRHSDSIAQRHAADTTDRPVSIDSISFILSSSIHEQASSSDLTGEFHSTFSYPLHSTLNAGDGLELPCLSPEVEQARTFRPKPGSDIRPATVGTELINREGTVDINFVEKGCKRNRMEDPVTCESSSCDTNSCAKRLKRSENMTSHRKRRVLGIPSKQLSRSCFQQPLSDSFQEDDNRRILRLPTIDESGDNLRSGGAPVATDLAPAESRDFDDDSYFRRLRRQMAHAKLASRIRVLSLSTLVKGQSEVTSSSVDATNGSSLNASSRSSLRWVDLDNCPSPGLLDEEEVDPAQRSIDASAPRSPIESGRKVHFHESVVLRRRRVNHSSSTDSSHKTSAQDNNNRNSCRCRCRKPVQESNSNPRSNHHHHLHHRHEATSKPRVPAAESSQHRVQQTRRRNLVKRLKQLSNCLNVSVSSNTVCLETLANL